MQRPCAWHCLFRQQIGISEGMTDSVMCPVLTLEKTKLPPVYMKSRRYQGPSPDEVALVEGARQLGFEFRGRTRTHATISFMGQEVRCGLERSKQPRHTAQGPLACSMHAM